MVRNVFISVELNLLASSSSIHSVFLLPGRVVGELDRMEEGNLGSYSGAQTLSEIVVKLALGMELAAGGLCKVRNARLNI